MDLFAILSQSSRAMCATGLWRKGVGDPTALWKYGEKLDPVQRAGPNTSDAVISPRVWH